MLGHNETPSNVGPEDFSKFKVKSKNESPNKIQINLFPLLGAHL